jgi:hypothetical protein
MEPRSRRRWLGIAALVIFLPTTPVPLAGEIRLRWDPVEGATGYRVFHGLDSGVYNGATFVGNVIETSIGGLADCTDHYLAVKAWNWAGESASFSNEIRGWPRPVVQSQLVNVMQGTQMTLDIRGVNFQPGAELVLTSGVPVNQLGEKLIRVESAAVLSCQHLQALFTIEPTARGFRAMEVGRFTVTFEVFNPDSVFGSGPVQLEVRLNPIRLDINRSDSHTLDRVDGKDLVWLAYSHGTQEGQPRFNPDADLNGDGTVDGEDLAHLAPGFGACWNGTAWTGCP